MEPIYFNLVMCASAKQIQEHLGEIVLGVSIVFFNFLYSVCIELYTKFNSKYKINHDPVPKYFV